MSTEFSKFFTANIEDPIYQKELIRPAEIKEDVKLLHQRRRVSNIMGSKLFKKSLENIFQLNNLENNSVGRNASTLYLADINEQLLLSAIPKKKIESLYQLIQWKGVIFINDLLDDVNSPYDSQEIVSRCKLASVFRLMDMYGWNNEFNTVLTMRPLNNREQYLINPFGLMFNEITSSSLISMDFKGNTLDYGSTILDVHPTKWLVHSAIYSSRHDIKVILHLKTAAAIYVSSTTTGLLPMSVEAILLGDVLILNNLYKIVKNENVLDAYKTYFATFSWYSSKLFIMPNSGFLICGNTVEEAWHLLRKCQEACDIQFKMSNFEMDDLLIPSKDVQHNILNQRDAYSLDNDANTNVSTTSSGRTLWLTGQREFEALMRYLDNSGCRSGYFYRLENIYQDNNIMKSKLSNEMYEVEIPPTYVCDSNKSQYYIQKEEKISDNALLQTKNDKWFNTPNKYKLLEKGNDSINGVGKDTGKKSSNWILSNAPNYTSSIPQHPVNAGAYVSFLSDVSRSNVSKEKSIFGINPKELKEIQKKVKNKYYNDTNTAGPMSCLLESGFNLEEKKRLKKVALQNQFGDRTLNDEVVTSASKAVIQKGQKAIVFQNLYKHSNPFENVTADDLNNYQLEIDRKLNPNRYTDHISEIHMISKEDETKVTLPQSQSLQSVSKQISNDDFDLNVERANIEVEETQPMFNTLEKPPCSTMTSETSGPDFSHDELDKKDQVKKKRRFKLPSFVKKKKDKNSKN